MGELRKHDCTVKRGHLAFLVHCLFYGTRVSAHTYLHLPYFNPHHPYSSSSEKSWDSKKKKRKRKKNNLHPSFQAQILLPVWFCRSCKLGVAFVFLHQWTKCFMRVEKYVKCKFSYLLLWLHWRPATLDLCISALLYAVAVCWIADERQTAHKLKLYLALCSDRSPATDQSQLLSRQEMSILKEQVWPRSWFKKTKPSCRMKDANVCLKASSTAHRTQRVSKCSPEVLSSGLLS